MTPKILRTLTCFLFVLSAAALLRADRDANRRNERIPVGHQMNPPWHPATKPSDSSSPTGNGYTPQQLRHAYGVDQLGTTGTGQIIALIEAYGSPTIQSDLDTFCAAFGLPSTTVQVYYPQGTPPANTSWESETSLDVEWAHAIAPGATIALIVAKSNSTVDLYGAVDYAVSVGATQVSMSWGSSEYSTEITSDYHFNVPGVTFFASSGDSGAGVGFPACSPYVVGVGGTSLNLDSSGNITSETAWSGSGGGMSAYETFPSYQAGWWSGARRGVPDVAYDADPNTGVPVYLTGSGWRQIGGTSMGAPQWAALYALANSLRSQSGNPSPGALYLLASANYAGYYHDITSGTDGNPAGPGYDLVTGLGSPVANQLVLALGGEPFQVAAPVFSPAPGAYLNAQNVTITTATPGTTIRYTTDGSTPSETNGTIYSGLVNIGSTATLQAIAYENGFTDSGITSGAFIIGQVAAPTFSPSHGIFVSSVTVTISTTANGASIRYTTDGSTPSETNGTLYFSPVKIIATATLQAIAYEAGFVDSTVASGSYAIYPPTRPPVFSPPAGTYTGPQTVAITSATTGASIRYTTDGSTPKYNSGILYSGPVPINVTTTLKAVAYYNYTSVIVVSQVITGIYTIAVPAATPVFNPAPGTYTTAQSVTITSATTGASIRYTTDGSTPTETNGTIYSAPVYISATTTLQAIAYESGFADSSVTSGVYTIILPAAPPVFNPAPGTYTAAQSVTITSATTGATIRYTTDGSTPSETNGTVYPNTAINIGSTTTLQAIAYESGFTDSQVAGGTYAIFLPAATPVFNPAAGTYTSIQAVTITTATSGATIRYTTDGSVPSETNGTICNNGPVSIGTTTTLQAIAYESGFTDSPVASGSYTIILPAATPVFNPAPGTYTTAQSVTITSATAGASIRYTTDGSTPTETNGMIYSGPANINQSTMLKAIAYETGFADSPVTGGLYVITTLPAAVLNVMYDFNSFGFGGYDPQAALAQDSDGNFYGTTENGGRLSEGTVFQLTPAGALTTLVSFTGIGTNGEIPAAGLVQGSDGNFYGTTENGGGSNDGTVFELTPAGVLTTLVVFNRDNGAFPQAALVQGSDGNFYGTTRSGGTTNGGTVFKMTSTGVLTTLASFDTSAFNPYGGVVQDADGNFYGTTFGGGSDLVGTVFKLTPAGVLTTLVSFNNTNGANPAGGLVQGTDGNFYGTTSYGGSANVGTVFKVTPAGVLTTLASFSGSYGAYPGSDLLQGSDGNFYGVTSLGGDSNAGTIFQMTPKGALTTLVSFDHLNGANPAAALVRGSDGNFYGTASNGGIFNSGVIYQLIVPSSLPVPGWTLRDFNGDGKPDILWHNTATGGTAVLLMNGTTPASFAPIGTIPPPWGIAAVGDFNHDGNADILWRNATTGEIGVTLMNGTSVTSYVSLGTVDLSWTVAGLGEFDNNGQTDILWQNASTGGVGFWSLTGTAVTGFTAIGTIPSPWTIVGAGDFTGNGHADLLWYNPTTGSLLVRLMDGASATGYQVIGSLPLPWTVAGTADFNGDGSVDILVRNATTGDVGIWLMNGTTPTSFVPLGNVPLPWQPSD